MPVAARARTGARPRAFALSAVVAVIASLLTIFAPTPAAQAAAGIGLTKSASGSVLLGKPISYTLTASNPAGGEQEYNLSFSDVLPVGVTYVPNSTTPSDVGEPTISWVTIDGDPHQVLVWANVSDLAVNSSVSLSFSATPDPVLYPVGSEVTNTARAYANTDPRIAPGFTANGSVKPGSFTEEAVATASPTSISAMVVTKSEPSVEGELTRGVHDRRTTYTITVTNNDDYETLGGGGDSDGVDVVDYLPAGLEFLGCGAVDNTTTGPEYPGAGPIGGGPVADCTLPDSVETVLDPPGYPAGVYTKVSWDIGDLAPGQTVTITYAAAIPLRENTMDFGGATPTPESLGQAANLDNNTGPSTRETGIEKTYVNRVEAEGIYTGPIVNPDGSPSSTNHVRSTASETVSAEDVAISKSVDTSTFVGNGIATYTLRIRTSEYTDASNIVITDVLPDGLCPIDDVANYAGTAECAPDPAYAVTGATIDTVVPQPDGSFVVTFNPVDLSAADGVHVITYKARMRQYYVGSSRPNDPTVSGDQYSNHVTLTADTTPIDDSSETGTVQVLDESSRTIGSDKPSLDKKIGTVDTSADCATATYIDTDASTDQSTIAFPEGSRVCFRIRAQFSSDNATRDAILVDMLPEELTFEPGSIVTSGTVPVDVETVDGNTLEWKLGAPAGGGSALYVPSGGVFEVTFSAIVTSAPVNGTDIDVTGNLAKLRYANSAGRVVSLRDKVDLVAPSAPPVSIEKLVDEVDGTSMAAHTAEVRGGSTATFGLAVTNQGSAANLNDLPVYDIRVWDVLPTGVHCLSGTQGWVSAMSNGAVCTDPGMAGHPSFDGSAQLSAITWLIPGPVAAAADTRVTYDITFQNTISVDATLANHAAVRSYVTHTNHPDEPTQTHYPADNIDNSVLPELEDAPAAADDAQVTTPDVTLDKERTSPVATNNTAGQAVVGEEVTYTITATIPAHTTVYNGVLTDPMPTGLTFVSATADWAPVAGGAYQALPGSVTFTPGSGTLSLGAVYTNASAVAQEFRVTVTAKVSTGNNHGQTRTNTATFSSTDAFGSPQTPRTDTASISVVAPLLTLSKTEDTGGEPVVSGQTVTYQLTVGNTAGRPDAHDTVLIDCVPAGLSVVGLDPAGSGTITLGGAPCAPEQTLITWDLGTVTAGNPGVTRRYDVVYPSVAGSAIYENTATVTGSTIADGGNDAANETVVAHDTTATVTAQSATVTKSADPTQLRPGEEGEWTLIATIPADVNFFDAAVIDQLPSQVDPTTVVTTEVTCAYDDSSPCTIPPGFSGELTPTSSTIGWGLGDITSDAKTRILTIKYTARLRTTAAVTRGSAVTNTADMRWNTVNGTNPTSAGATFDKNSPDGTATVTVQEPLLSINKTVGDATPVPGETFTYTVTVTNSNAANVSEAHNVVITDSVPAGVVVDESSISPAGTLSADGRTITWNLTGSIAKNGSRTLTYDAVLADSDTLTGSALVNTAAVTSYESLATGGKSYSGPSDTASVTPTFPHVSVAKSVVGGAVAYRETEKSWQITVTNDSTTTAYAVSVRDVLPADWSYVDDTAMIAVNGGAASPIPPALGTTGGAQTLTWANIGDLAPGAIATIVFVSLPSATATVGNANPHINTVSVTAEDATGATHNASGDYNSAPATAQAQISSADVSVTKSHTGTAIAGAPLTWTIKVSNAGPDTATGPFVVTDTLPDNAVSATASGTDWSCTTAAPTITCTYGAVPATTTLANGASLPDITVVTELDSTEPESSTSTNAASVTHVGHDPDSSNNSHEDVATLTTRADLELTKLHPSGATVTAGENETYTISLTNNGPSVARGPIVVSDPIPAGTSFVSVDGGAAWDCDDVAGTIICTHDDDLAVNASAANDIVVEVKVDPGRTTAVTNAATITSSGTTDPTPGNNTSSVVTSVDRAADLSIEKSSPGEFTPGETGVYRLAVRNNAGPSTAAAVRITDTLPSYLSYVSFANVSGTWSCSAAGQVVTCDLTGELGVDASASLDLTVEVASSHTGAIENAATVSSSTDDPNPANNTDDDDAASDLESDLSIVKSHTGSAVAGEEFTYTLQVRNNGPSDINGTITVSDALPTGMSFVSASGTNWTCDATDGVATCTRNGVLAKGADAAPITLRVLVDSAVRPGTIVNTATVSGPAENSETDPDNNSSSDPTTVVNEVNVSIAKDVVGPTNVVAGTSVTFELTVHNDGPSDADNVTVTDTMPTGFTIDDIDTTGWDCASSTTTQLSCTLATLAAGTTAPVIAVAADIASDLGRASVPDPTATNTASVATTSPGDDPADNESSVTLTILRRADLELRKSHPSGPVVAGTPVTFTLEVTNNGASDARGPLTVVDTLPAGMTYLGHNSGAWSCTPGAVTGTGQEVTCTSVGLDYLDAGLDAPALELTVQVASDQADATLINSAVASSETTDPTPGNNTDTDDVQPVGVADLSIVKSHSGAVHIGDELEFTLVVHNDGPSDAEDVVVTDDLPAGLDFVSAQGTGWTCTEASGTVTCELSGPLSTGATADPITLTVTVRPAAYPTATNIAEVESTTTDLDPSDNSDGDELVVPALTNLALTKSHVGSELKVGQHAVYQVRVTNSGPTDDPGPITIRDELPVGLSYVSASGTGWVCTSAPGAAGTDVVTCVNTSGLRNGSSSDLELTTMVGAAAYPSVSNTASVSSASEETSTADNADSDVAPVLPTANLAVKKTVDKKSDAAVRWKITVTNNGPNATVDPVIVVDKMPKGLQLESAKGKGWDCVTTAKKVRCTRKAPMANGEVASFTVTTTITAKPGTKIRNTATVVSGSTEGVSPASAAAVTSPRGTGAGGARPNPGGKLPNTGGPSRWLLPGGVALAIIGGGLLLIRRRRDS